jgi:hypothetical protein
MACRFATALLVILSELDTAHKPRIDCARHCQIVIERERLRGLEIATDATQTFA